METKNDCQKEFNTCLEDVSFAESMQNAKSRRETGLPAGRFQGGEDTSMTGNKPKTRRLEMVESIMNLHRCADCAIRCSAAEKPNSFFARMHRWHAGWWPGWKMYQAELRAKAAVDNKRIGENL